MKKALEVSHVTIELMCVAVLFLAGTAGLKGELKEVIYSKGDSVLRVSVKRIDVLIKSQDETPSYPGLIEFEGKLILPHHRTKPGASEYQSRDVAAISNDGGKTWTDLPSDSPFSDIENSGIYGYLRDGTFLYVDTFAWEGDKRPEGWGKEGYDFTQKIKNPSFQVRRFSRDGKLVDTWRMRVLNVPWQEAAYQTYGSILELDNGDLLTAFQCQVGPPKEEDAGFAVFVARSTDGGRTFKHAWTLDPVVDGKRIGGQAFCEPDMAVLPNGDILCIMRTGSYSPMYQARSKDGGRMWSQPESIGWPGVKPRLRVLKNGVLACTSGRGSYGHPQVTYAMFSIDGTGEVWEPPLNFYTGLGDNYTWNMEREGKLYVVYSHSDLTKPAGPHALPYRSINWAVLKVTKEKRE